MTSSESNKGLTLFTGAAVLLIILWVPVHYVLLPGINEYFMMACIWVGLIHTIAIQSRRTMGYPITLFFVFQGYLAVTGYTFLQETGFFLSVSVGIFIYSVRIGKSTRNCFLQSLKIALICLLSLRITSFVIFLFRDRIFENEYLIALSLSSAVIIVMFLNYLFKFLVEESGMKGLKPAFREYLHSVIYPVIFILFLLPAAMQTIRISSNVLEWNLLTGVITIIVIQTGLSVLLDKARFSYSRTRFLEDELGKHSKILSDLDTSIEALRILANFWYQASEPEAVRITWSNISMTYPTGFEPSVKATLSRKGKEGLLLEVWPSPETILDKDRIDIFILQTETVLKNLELRDSVFKSGWKCLEAMVYSLDMSDSRQTGYSRIVANIAKEIGREMGMQRDALDDLEMAAMLHLTAAILEKAEEDWQEAFASDPARVQFQLPLEVVAGIKHFTENYDGSGKPDNLRGKSIPTISRILSVASNFTSNLSNQSVGNAILELKRRSGLIYDPDIVEILETIAMQKDRMTFSEFGI